MLSSLLVRPPPPVHPTPPEPSWTLSCQCGVHHPWSQSWPGMTMTSPDILWYGATHPVMKGFFLLWQTATCNYSWLACLQSEAVILCYISGVIWPLQYLQVCRLKPKLGFCFHMPCVGCFWNVWASWYLNLHNSHLYGTLSSGTCFLRKWSSSRPFLSFLPHLEQAQFFSNDIVVRLQ